MKKKLLSVLLAVSLVTGLVACGNAGNEAAGDATEQASDASDESAEPDVSDAEEGEEEAVTGSSAPEWDAYDALITEIRNTTDFAKRVDLMHQAEDMLM